MRRRIASSAARRRSRARWPRSSDAIKLGAPGAQDRVEREGRDRPFRPDQRRGAPRDRGDPAESCGRDRIRAVAAGEPRAGDAALAAGPRDQGRDDLRRPFWRDDGLTGTSYDHISVMGETADSSNPESISKAGILTGFVYTDNARKVAPMAPEERKKLLLGEVAKRFGPKALSRSTITSPTGRPTSGPAAASPASSPPARPRCSAPRCAIRSARSAGPAPRPRPTGRPSSTARSAPASARRRRSERCAVSCWLRGRAIAAPPSDSLPACNDARQDSHRRFRLARSPSSSPGACARRGSIARSSRSRRPTAAFDEMKPRGVILSGGPESVHEAGSPARAAGDFRGRRAGARHLLRPADDGGAARRHGRGRASPRIRPRRCRGESAEPPVRGRVAGGRATIRCG